MNLAEIFLKLLNMSFTGAVAIVVVLLVRLLFKKLPKRILHKQVINTKFD